MRLHALASPDRPLASDRRLAAETNSDGHSRSKANECLGVALSVVPERINRAAMAYEEKRQTPTEVRYDL